MKHKHPTKLPPYAPPPVTIVMADDGALPAPARFDGLRRPLRHLREQVKVLTGWGLHPLGHAATHVERQSLPEDALGVRLSYLSAGDASGRRVIFIHGSPGQGDEWLSYLANGPADQCRIAVDRAGYGASLPAAPLPTVATQAEVIAPLLTPGCILVGYSYGGPVALKLAVDYPQSVAAVVLISCPIDVTHEHVHVVQRLFASRFMAWLLPKGLHASNIELLSFGEDLAALVPMLGKVTAKVTLLQGLRDTLVPPEAAEILAKLLSGRAAPRRILMPIGDHYLPWTYRATIEQAIAYAIRDCAD